jgi:hypothetical protein
MVVPLGLRPGFPAGAGEGGGRRALGLGRIAATRSPRRRFRPPSTIHSL